MVDPDGCRYKNSVCLCRSTCANQRVLATGSNISTSLSWISICHNVQEYGIRAEVSAIETFGLSLRISQSVVGQGQRSAAASA